MLAAGAPEVQLPGADVEARHEDAAAVEVERLAMDDDLKEDVVEGDVEVTLGVVRKHGSSPGARRPGPSS